MNNKNLKILAIVSSVLLIGGLSFFFYKKRQQKKISETYKNSLDEMTKKYGKELFN
jgi:hypothetical protein